MIFIWRRTILPNIGKTYTIDMKRDDINDNKKKCWVICSLYNTKSLKCILDTTQTDIMKLVVKFWELMHIMQCLPSFHKNIIIIYRKYTKIRFLSTYKVLCRYSSAIYITKYYHINLCT